MRAIAVDDENLALEDILQKLNNIDIISSCTGFSDPYKALEFIKENKVDIAFLDIEMYGLNGLELAKKMKDIRKNIKVIFITGFSSFAVDAIHLHANGYLLKPANEKDILKEINYIIETDQKFDNNNNDKKIKIQTFGNFEVFVSNKPLRFKRNKTKELLAYLIDRRGASASKGEIIAVLWEEKEDSSSLRSLFRTLVADLDKTLKENNVGDFLINSRNNLSIIANMVDCDYYNFLHGDINAINSYAGEYMANYSWAEFTVGFLDEQKSEIKNK